MLRTPWWMRYTVLIINIIQVAVSQKTATIKMTACYSPRRGDPYYVTPPTGCLSVIFIKSYT